MRRWENNRVTWKQWVGGRMTVLGIYPLLPLLGLLGGCGGSDAPPQRTALGSGVDLAVEQLSPQVQLQLASGNVAFRDREYAAALDHFSAVVRADPQLAAGWYGVGMTHRALGNSSAADSAMAEVHRLAPEIPLDHPSTSAPPNPHPIQPAAASDQD